MMVNVLLFGITKDVVGKQRIRLEFSGNITVSEFRKNLVEKYPELIELNAIAVAVNSEYATDKTLIHESDEVALIPPVSGG